MNIGLEGKVREAMPGDFISCTAGQAQAFRQAFNGTTGPVTLLVLGTGYKRIDAFVPVPAETPPSTRIEGTAPQDAPMVEDRDV